MELHNLKPAKGSIGKAKKRLGRGQGSTDGKTAGRGHKGAQSRSGYSQKLGFEGGQMPLQRRMPKVGFKNFSRLEYTGLNLSKIQHLIDNKGLTEFTVDSLRANHIIGKSELVKILATGELTSKIDVAVHGISEAAKAKIEALGGTVTIVKK